MLLLFCSSSVFGQNMPIGSPAFYGMPSSRQIANDEGYVITNNNDSLFGIVLLLKDGNFITVSLINKITNKAKIYRADKIKKFKVGKSFYESLVLNDAHYFFRKLITGPVSLFDQPETPKRKSTSGNIDTASTKEIKRKYYLLKNDYLVKVSEAFFKKNMMEYFKDCEILCKKIENEELALENIEEIVSEYNEWYISKK